MILRNALLYILVFLPFFLSAHTELSFSEVHAIMNEMLSLHVEHKEFSPVLAERSINLFIQQFDMDKRYLLKNEVDGHLKSVHKKKNKVMKNCKGGNYCDFIELNALVCSGIQRAALIREEIERNLALFPEEREVTVGETFLEHPRTVDELRERIKIKVIRFYNEEKKLCKNREMTPQIRSKIFSLYEKKVSRFENSYLNTKSNHPLCVHILRSFSKSLDAHSYFFTPDEAMQMKVGLVKEFEGVGIMLRETIDGIVVSGIVKGSPADKSGKLFVGDYITEIDQIATANLTYEEILDKLKNNQHEEIRIQVVRYHSGGKKEVDQVSLKRETISLSDERLQMKLEPFGRGVIAKIDLPSFYDSPGGLSAEKELKDVLLEIQEKENLLGVVLDLRNNLGGFLNQAVKVASLFISTGVVVVSKYAGGETKVSPLDR